MIITKQKKIDKDKKEEAKMQPKEEKENIKPIKSMFLGESWVGKTSLIARIITNHFDENIETTYGSCYATKKIKIYKKEYDLDLWDINSKKMKNLFYCGSKIIIFVYDITNKHSFQELNNWKKTEEIIDDDFIKGIIANKIDLHSEEQISKMMENLLQNQLMLNFCIFQEKLENKKN